MPDTTKQIISRIYTLLRDPSQDELHADVVRERLNSRLRVYVQDINLEGRDQRTVTARAEVTLDNEGFDFIISVGGEPEFEALGLEYSPSVSSSNQAWYEARLVPFESWARNFGGEGVVASIYSSGLVEQGARLKLNVDPDMVSTAEWRLSYRRPLVVELQMGDKPPMPAPYIPLLEYDVALECMSLVKNNSGDWKDWVKDNRPVYGARVVAELQRWQAYLDQSTESPEQPITPWDMHRRGTGRAQSIRGYLPSA